MNDAPLYPIAISLPYQGQQVRFKTHDSLREWAEANVSVWKQAVARLPEVPGLTEVARRHLISPAKELRNLTHLAQQAPSLPSNWRANVLEVLHRYSTGGAISHESTAGRHILELINKGDGLAALGAIYQLTGRSIGDLNITPQILDALAQGQTALAPFTSEGLVLEKMAARLPPFYEGPEAQGKSSVALVGFRIKNFRSIVDSGECEFGADGITAIVGQNESGKTSILQALVCTALGNVTLSDDDTRINDPLPQVSLKLRLDEPSWGAWFDKFRPSSVNALRAYLKGSSGCVRVTFDWSDQDAAERKYKMSSALPTDVAALLAGSADVGSVSDETGGGKPRPKLSAEGFLDQLIAQAPALVLFQAEEAVLPNDVDIDTEKLVLKGDGFQAAYNFLAAAKLDLKTLVRGSKRQRDSLLASACERLNKDLATFWQQKIGKSRNIKIQVEYCIRGMEDGDRAGQPSLAFWIIDGPKKLYPRQRSTGVRWFVSFYLQLRASQNDSDQLMFLLDEPGANLHPKAQEDVLRLVNALKETLPIVYTSHSPHLIEQERLYRVLAVQRGEGDEDSPTEVISATDLAHASTDTLSPILTAMGVDLSHQNVIEKTNNVILEEPSAFYYLKGFLGLSGIDKRVNFLPATGVGKVPLLANLFLGWGLEFVVAVDDDNAGRQSYNELRANLFCGDADRASRSMYKIPFPGIEDIFSWADFNKHICELPARKPEQHVSAVIKSTGNSKPVLAYQFFEKTCERKIVLNDFEQETKDNIFRVLSEIIQRLEQKDQLRHAVAN